MAKRDPDVELVERPGSEIEDTDEPPVVARLVVEIRSDGTRTIARGAVEDTELGQRTVIEARGTTPAQLAWSLAKTIASAPALARQVGRAMLSDAPPKRGNRRRSLVGRLARRVGRRILGDDKS
jgi:hypothetical protein